MNYEDFGREMTAALEETGLAGGLFQVEDTLAPASGERTQTIWLNPGVGRAEELFNPAARVRWTWGPIETARSKFCEEDVLESLLGRGGRSRRTEPRHIRVDARICAYARHDAEPPLPGEPHQRRWATEAMREMEERFTIRKAKIAGYPEAIIMSWLGVPELRAACGTMGELRVKELRIEAGQFIEVPRTWDDPDRRAGRGPRRAMLDLCKRIASALDPWARAARHLLPESRRSGRLH